MTQAEKTAKIVDLQRQIRKIRRTIKCIPIPSKRWSINKAINYSARLVRLCMCKGILKARLQQLQSQQPRIFEGILQQCK